MLPLYCDTSAVLSAAASGAESGAVHESSTSGFGALASSQGKALNSSSREVNLTFSIGFVVLSCAAVAEDRYCSAADPWPMLANYRFSRLVRFVH